MNIIPMKIQIKICQNSITSLYVVILKIVEFEKGGNDRSWFISSDRYSNEEILRAWPRARHGMEWQLKLDSSYFKRYFSQPLWLRFFSSSSYSLIFSSPVFLDSRFFASVNRNIFGPLLWWGKERERDSMIVSLWRVLFERFFFFFFFSRGTLG